MPYQFKFFTDELISPVYKKKKTFNLLNLTQLFPNST